jgi:hypothetical protein
MRLPRRHVAIVVAGTAGLAVAGVATALSRDGRSSSSAVPAAASVSNSYPGSITSASGRYLGDHGQLKVDPSGLTALHAGRLVITSAGCHGKPHCLALSGRPTGTLTPAGRQNPDIGRHSTLHASGQVRPLGHVSITGTLQLPGFIICGRETLTMTLTASHGTVSATASTRLNCGQGPTITGES